MGASSWVGRVGGVAAALGVGAVVFAAGQGVASASPENGPADRPSDAASAGRDTAGQRQAGMRRAARTGAAQAASTATRAVAPSAAARAQKRRPVAAVRPTPAGEVPPASRTGPRTAVDLPQMPITEGWSFTVAPESVAEVAAGYVTEGGDPADAARFFFGDLAVTSLDTLAGEVTPDQARLQLGNLAVSGYFGGIWLRDNLRAAPTAAPAAEPAAEPGSMATPVDLTVSAIGIRLFDALATGLMGAAAAPGGVLTRTAAHASVPVLLALYGYNRGYLEVLLENPPPGVPPLGDTLVCEGFLDCNSDAFPLEIAHRYDAGLQRLESPTNLRWREMSLMTAVLEGATGAGRFVWEAIASAGAFSPASYQALVELSSAYLMVSKAAVLAGMLGYADGDTELARSALRLQAGLWIWSGAYFAGLASNAPAGTMPAIVTDPA